jgi:ribonuclease HII
MSILCGVDEAGRGPMIGPLVICGVNIDDDKVNELIKIGVKDSKYLSPKQREALFPQIKQVVKSYKLIIVPASEVDDALNSPNLNLNWLEAIHTALIIGELDPERAIVDCPSNNIQAYTEYLSNLLKKKIPLKLEHNAERYPVVAAASILAKVTRDNEIEKLKETHGDFGSGYPSDPKTKAYLLKNWKTHESIFRKTWKSYSKVANQAKLTDY